MKSQPKPWSRFKQATITIAALLCALAFTDTSSAQNITARISTRETYVGQPIVLQLQISNASKHTPPTIPPIDGCTSKQLGTASQSSRISIINGRRTESHSVRINYQITPQREGTFEIPPLELTVDGKTLKTKASTFVATQSETGDLLFAEIEGAKDKVYVGEPLDLKLKIWIKPFQDRKKEIQLSEGSMWQMISARSNFGNFLEAMEELAQNRKPPKGKDTLRKDEQGVEHAYYLYEITATVYPTRTGKIDSGDVQIVVNYPTAIGQSRDRFEQFFGGSSGGRLAVTSSRPITAVASVDSTEVIAIPTAGRPDDYRGAVGRYQVVTEAGPTNVKAGDPITLRIGVIGDGPMELVQAPPLSEINSITNDFKVVDQSLAGFSQDKSKVFTTTIRPRRAGIIEIPGVPFSFFDPESETFKTALSQPITINVDPSETLSLDAIVSNSSKGGRAKSDLPPPLNTTLAPDFQNDFTNEVLTTDNPTSQSQWWWYCVIVPPFFWLATLLLKYSTAIGSWVPSFRSAQSKCANSVKNASTSQQLSAALTQYISARTTHQVDSSTQAIGALRILGLPAVANEVESFFGSIEKNESSTDHQPNRLNDQKEKCLELVSKLESAIGSASNHNIRTNPKSKPRNNRIKSKGPTIGLLVLLIYPSSTWATQPPAADQNHLTQSQQELLLKEANAFYQDAQKIMADDQAEANHLFTQSAEKYQTLVDAGISNSRLFLNLGNAQIRQGRLAQAIANYHRALRMDPNSRQAQANLQFAEDQIQKGRSKAAGPDNADPQPDTATNDTAINFDSTSSFVSSTIAHLKSLNQNIVQRLGLSTLKILTAAASMLFWLVLILRTTGCPIPAMRLVLIPLLTLTLCGGSILLHRSSLNTATGILVANQLELRFGDGNEFEVVAELESSAGQAVRILNKRNHWVQVQTAQGTGWLPSKSIEQINDLQSTH